MRRLLPLLLLAATFFALTPVPAPAVAKEKEKPAAITKGELRDWVKVLADDDWKGREAGEPGCDAAADLIAAELKRLGLTPVGDDGTYFQAFQRPRGMKVLETTSLTVVDKKGKETSFKLAIDFSPHDLSSKGSIDADVVFAGFGISAPSLGYDDYEGLDVKDKVVVILRHAPNYGDRKSPFANAGAMQRHGTWQAKVDLAVKKGAAALVTVNDPLTFNRKSSDALKPPGGTQAGKIPVFHMTWNAGKKFGSKLGVKLVSKQKRIDAKLRPASEALDGVRIKMVCDLAVDVRKMKNVVGLIEPERATTGDGAKADGDTANDGETVVLGAHYDHVGVGRFGSVSKATGQIHNGADDNASGTSALLEIAGLLASRRSELKRPILCIWFSGEELGLWGSKHYAGAPVVPLAKTVAMVNLDMVGRLDKNHLMIGGTGTSPIWPELLETLNQEGKFKLTKWPGGKAPSDHTSFYEKDVPVLFFFTGLHNDYHTPADDWNTLNYAGQERVARMAANVALHLATMPERPQFTKCDIGGFAVGPYSGLAVEQKEDGVYVAHVEKKSPASRARFKVGDRIVEWNTMPVKDTTVYNSLVSKAKPGDKVDVIVNRGGKEKRLKMKLGST